MYFVYNADDYAELGGCELTDFDKLSDALAYIEKRISENPQERSIENYTLIEGKRLSLEVVEVVKKVAIKSTPDTTQN